MSVKKKRMSKGQALDFAKLYSSNVVRIDHEAKRIYVRPYCSANVVKNIQAWLRRRDLHYLAHQVAYKITVGDDRGGAYTFCSNCETDVITSATDCPQCKRKLIWGSNMSSSGAIDSY